MSTLGRSLWTSDSKTTDACDGISGFSGGSSKLSDQMMGKIVGTRNGDSMRDFLSDTEFFTYFKTLLAYAIPWAVLFVLSFFGL